MSPVAYGLPTPPDPPANDDFANAILLSGDSGSVGWDNTGATAETPDPLTDDHGSSSTVWWKFVPSSDGSATFSTSDSGGSPVGDTILGIYTGDDLGSLTEIAFDDDTDTLYSSATVDVVSGTTYYIEVAGYGGEEGTFTFSWDFVSSAPPPPTTGVPVPRSEMEVTWQELEPPGLTQYPWLFPVDSDTFWGSMRKVFADYLQQMPNALSRWWSGLNMAHIVTDDGDDSDLAHWERMLGIPVNPVWPVSLRKTLLQVRWFKGPFTRARRLQIIELFLMAFLVTSSDIPIEFGTGGMVFEDGGTAFGIDLPDLAGTYSVTEDIPGFSYQVNILDTYYTDGFDDSDLARELDRITPDPITFTIVSTPTP